MTYSEIFLIIIISIVLVAVGIRYFLWRDWINDKNSIDEIWQKFMEAELNDDLSNIKYFGDKLIWNRHLKKEQLKQLMEIVEKRRSKTFSDGSLDKLANDAFNKKLHHDRIIPRSGSSGGIKQSW